MIFIITHTINVSVNCPRYLMIYLSLFISINAAAISSDDKVIDVYKKFSKIQAQYEKDSISTRDVRSKFIEFKFEPAFNKMLVELKKDNCKSCILEYLKTISSQNKSSDELYSDQLAILINNYPDKLNLSCTKLNEKDKINLHGFFEVAIQTLKLKYKKETRSEIFMCLGN